MPIQKKLAIICGGDSSESAIAQKSAKTIFDQVDRRHFLPFLVEISRKGWYVDHEGARLSIDKNGFTFSLDGRVHAFDSAYITIHGTPGEDGKLQGYFDMIQLPYCNTGAFAAALTCNKWACNRFLQTLGIATAKSVLLREKERPYTSEIADKLGFPCFVKPNKGGSSYGVSKVSRLAELPAAVEKAFAEGEEVLVEALVEGREVTCGLYASDTSIVPLPLTEIKFEGEFFNYTAKYEGGSQEITPAALPEGWSEKVQTTSKLIYKELDLRGSVRMDYLLTPEGVPYLIEVNTNPGMSAASIFPQQVAASGRSLREVLTTVIRQSGRGRRD